MHLILLNTKCSTIRRLTYWLSHKQTTSKEQKKDIPDFSIEDETMIYNKTKKAIKSQYNNIEKAEQSFIQTESSQIESFNASLLSGKMPSKRMEQTKFNQRLIPKKYKIKKPNMSNFINLVLHPKNSFSKYDCKIIHYS